MLVFDQKKEQEWSSHKHVEKILGKITTAMQSVSGKQLGILGLSFKPQTNSVAGSSSILLAKRLLTDTTLPVIEVAYASGFSSLRRFNALFSERYRLNPTSLRKSSPQDPPRWLVTQSHKL